MDGLIERAAKAHYEASHDMRVDMPWDECHQSYRKQKIDAMRAAFEAMKYTDCEEGQLIAASNQSRVEAVSLAEAWDAMIEETLRPSPSPPPRLPGRYTPDFAALFRSMGVEVIDITPSIETQMDPPPPKG